jgi:hypothetical protein
MYGPNQETEEPNKYGLCMENNGRRSQPLEMYYQNHAMPKTRLRSALIKKKSNFKISTAE